MDEQQHLDKFVSTDPYVATFTLEFCYMNFIFHLSVELNLNWIRIHILIELIVFMHNFLP